MNKEEAAFEGDSGNCVHVGANVSYKYITYDPSRRQTDGICSRKYRVHFAWFFHSNDVLCILVFGSSPGGRFHCLIWILLAQDSVNFVDHVR